MNKVLLVDASSSDGRIMAALFTKAGYNPITAEELDAAKEAVAKLPPGAVVVVAMKFTGGTAREFINWQKREGYKFHVIAIVDKLILFEVPLSRVDRVDRYAKTLVFLPSIFTDSNH